MVLQRKEHPREIHDDRKSNGAKEHTAQNGLGNIFGLAAAFLCDEGHHKRRRNGGGNQKHLS